MSFTAQGSYGINESGLPGQLADGTKAVIDTCILSDAGASFGAAIFAKAGTAFGTALPASGVFLGIVVGDAGEVPRAELLWFGAGPSDTIGPGDEASLLKKGDIWVLAGSATTAGAQAYFTSTGVLTAVASGNTALPASFLDTVGVGATSRLRVAGTAA